MSSRPKDWAISKEEARALELASMQRISDENDQLRKDLAAITAEKELWRRRCAEETIAWADEVNANREQFILWGPRSDVLTAAAKTAKDNAELRTRVLNELGIELEDGR